MALLAATWLFTSAFQFGLESVEEKLATSGGLFAPLVVNGEYWRLGTAIFLHANALHLILNCFALYHIGSIAHRQFQWHKTLLIFGLSGVFGNAVSFFFIKDALSVGASGALFGLLGAITAYIVANRSMFNARDHRFTLSVMLIIIAISLAYGVIDGNVDNWAHLGGLICGYATGFFLAHRECEKESPSAMAKITVVPATILLTLTLVVAGGIIVTSEDKSYFKTVKADMLFKEGDVEGALALADEAVTLDSLNAEALLLRGATRAAQGERYYATVDLGKALRLGLGPSNEVKAIQLLLSIQDYGPPEYRLPREFGP
jgi:membrane associated rhomboid family serine protease